MRMGKKYMVSKKIRNSVIILTLITGFLSIETNHVEAKVIPRTYIISNASTYELTYGNIQVTPYSSYESRLDEAKTLVAKAENSGIDSDILDAKNLVDTLTDGQDKTDLLSRIKNIIPYRDRLTAATNAVVKAESSRDQIDVNYAIGLVNALPIGDDGSSLLSRLDKVQAIINNNLAEQQALANATNAVIKAEGSRAQTDVNCARNLVNALPIGNDKNNLLSRLNAIQTIIDNNTTYPHALSNAINAVIKAEGSRAQTDVNYARDLVNALPIGNDRNNLLSRLDAIQAIINNNTPYQQALNSAINAVNRAESSRVQIDVNYARDLVNALPIGNDRNNLLSRLDAIQAIINNNTSYPQALNNAINAVNRAESSRAQTDVNYARNLVNALPIGNDRNNLLSRLDAIQAAINNNTTYPKDLNNAINAVNRAESSRVQTDVNYARSLVNSLPWGNDRSSLSSRLDLIQRIIDNRNGGDTNYYRAVNDATNAVIRAENFRSQVDIDSARTLVNNLNYEDRAYLGARLDAVQAIVNNRSSNQESLINIANDAVIRAERSLIQNDVDSARALINSLSDGTYKTSLNYRLNVVQNVISNRYLPNIIKSRQLPILDNRSVNQHKVWIISFDKEVEINSSTMQNITVTDSRGNRVDVSLKLTNNKSIAVLSPSNGYAIGERYTLNISNGMRSKNRQKLNREIKMNFTITR